MNELVAKRLGNRLYYGWIMVAVGAVVMFFSSPGQTYAISAFIDAYIEEFGFSRGLISSIYSIATLLSGTLMFFMGKMVDRFGERIMLLVVGTVLALTSFYNSYVTTIPMLTVGFFLSRYFGQGSLTLIPGTLIPQWFKKSRGLAMSILKFGIAVASVTVPIVNVYMIRTYGWQATWRIWGLLLIVIFLPMVGILVINTPEEIGLKPDNEVLTDAEMEEEAREVEANSWHVKEAVRTAAFWQLGLVAMLGPLITTGLNFHFFSIMKTGGIGTGEAAVALGMMGVPGFVVSLVSGFLIDRIGERKILVGGLGFMALGLIGICFAFSLPFTIGVIMVYGIGYSSYFVAVSVCWPNFYGRKYLGSIQGVATFFMVFGSAFGPVPFGFTYDYFGTYMPVLLAMAAVYVLGMWVAFSIRKPVKNGLPWR